MIGEHLSERREYGLAVHPRRVRPQVGADERLGAVEKDFFHFHHEPAARRPPLHRQGLEPGRVGGQRGPSVQPERLVHARNHEQQSHLRVLENVPQRVHAVVAGPVGQEDGAIVEDLDETRRIAPRRAVDPPVRAGRGEDHERREPDELPAVPIQAVERLLHRPLARLAVAAPYLLHRPEGLIRHLPPRIRASIRRPSCAMQRKPLNRSVRRPRPPPNAWRQTYPPRTPRRRRSGRTWSRRSSAPPALRAAPK